MEAFELMCGLVLCMAFMLLAIAITRMIETKSVTPTEYKNGHDGGRPKKTYPS